MSLRGSDSDRSTLHLIGIGYSIGFSRLTGDCAPALYRTCSDGRCQETHDLSLWDKSGASVVGPSTLLAMTSRDT